MTLPISALEARLTLPRQAGGRQVRPPKVAKKQWLVALRLSGQASRAAEK